MQKLFFNTWKEEHSFVNDPRFLSTSGTVRPIHSHLSHTASPASFLGKMPLISLVCVFEGEKERLVVAWCTFSVCLWICARTKWPAGFVPYLWNVTKSAAYIEWQLHQKGTLMKAVSLSKRMILSLTAHQSPWWGAFWILSSSKLGDTSLSLSLWNPLSICTVYLRWLQEL